MDCNVEIHTLSDEEEMEGDGDAIIFADEIGSQPDVIKTDEKKKGLRNINLITSSCHFKCSCNLLLFMNIFIYDILFAH